MSALQRTESELAAIALALSGLSPATRLKDVGEDPINDPGSGQVASFRSYVFADGFALGDFAAAAAGVVQQICSGALVVTEEPATSRTCKGCGCTELFACEDGCVWVTPDTCSSCVEEPSGIVIATEVPA